MPGSRKSTSHHWSGETKFAVVMETSRMNATELSAYCRNKGLYPEQVSEWRQECIEGVSAGQQRATAESAALKHSQHQIKKLQKELRRKDKALAESAALLVLQKKFQALWEDEES